MKKHSRRRRTLDTRFAASSTPIFLLDDRRRILFFNAGCVELTGWSPADVLGQLCDYATEGDGVTALTGNLCPPPEVFAGKPAAVPAHLPHRDGRSLPRLLNFYPLTGADGALETILGVITSIAPPKSHSETTPAQRLHAELASLRAALRQRFGLRSFVARTPAMRRVLEQIELARATRAAVTLHGEAGTGKEHVARLIHYEGEERARAFVPLDCRATPAVDLKLTLRRLFDQDEDDRHGPAMPMLHAGAVYLANADHTPRDVQEYLVEVYRRDPPRIPDIRLLAGTSSSLLDEARAREDLLPDFYYLLTPIRIDLPPLRARPDDLRPLAQHFVETLNRGAERQVGGFSEDVWKQFTRYNWPGNLDELAVVIAEARAAATADVVQVRDLPFRFRTGIDAQTVGPAIQPQIEPLEPLLERIEREQIEQALTQTRHNKSKAAELLGLTRPRLYRRMQALGIADLETDGAM